MTGEVVEQPSVVAIVEGAKRIVVAQLGPQHKKVLGHIGLTFLRHGVSEKSKALSVTEEGSRGCSPLKKAPMRS